MNRHIHLSTKMIMSDDSVTDGVVERCVAGLALPQRGASGLGSADWVGGQADWSLRGPAKACDGVRWFLIFREKSCGGL